MFFSLTSDYGDTVCIFHREVVLSQPNHVSKAITRHTERTKMVTGKKGKTAYPAEGERLLLEHERCGDVDAVVRVDAEGRGRSGGVVLVDWSRRNRW